MVDREAPFQQITRGKIIASTSAILPNNLDEDSISSNALSPTTPLTHFSNEAVSTADIVSSASTAVSTGAANLSTPTSWLSPTSASPNALFPDALTASVSLPFDGAVSDFQLDEDGMTASSSIQQQRIIGDKASLSLLGEDINPAAADAFVPEEVLSDRLPQRLQPPVSSSRRSTCNGGKVGGKIGCGAGGGGRKKNGKWLAKLEELKTYKLKHGDCVVPRGYAENPHLATWVAEQRKQYKLLRDGRQSNISQERIDLLNALDFTWNAQEAAWDRSFQVLKRFREEHGHCHVPNNQAVYRKLGLWVKEQRRHYSLLKQGKPSQMTYQRCKILDSVGFCWNTSEATWLERLKQLTAYKKQHGDCNVPKSWPHNPELSNFVQNQRKHYRQYLKGESGSCGMTRERVRALKRIGFNFNFSAAGGEDDDSSHEELTDEEDVYNNQDDQDNNGNGDSKLTSLGDIVHAPPFLSSSPKHSKHSLLFEQALDQDTQITAETMDSNFAGALLNNTEPDFASSASHPVVAGLVGLDRDDERFDLEIMTNNANERYISSINGENGEIDPYYSIGGAKKPSGSHNVLNIVAL